MNNGLEDPIKSVAEGVVKGFIEGLLDKLKINLPTFRRYKIEDFDARKTKRLQGATSKEITLRGKYIISLNKYVNDL